MSTCSLKGQANEHTNDHNDLNFRSTSLSMTYRLSRPRAQLSVTFSGQVVCNRSDGFEQDHVSYQLLVGFRV